jgi:hypothetical protein
MEVTKEAKMPNGLKIILAAGVVAVGAWLFWPKVEVEHSSIATATYATAAEVEILRVQVVDLRTAFDTINAEAKRLREIEEKKAADELAKKQKPKKYDPKKHTKTSSWSWLP